MGVESKMTTLFWRVRLWCFGVGVLEISSNLGKNSVCGFSQSSIFRQVGRKVTRLSIDARNASCLFMRQWEDANKHTALAGFASDLQFGVVAHEHMLHNRQTQTGSACAAIAAGINAIKTFG